jgi:hypothetical protein
LRLYRLHATCGFIEVWLIEAAEAFPPAAARLHILPDHASNQEACIVSFLLGWFVAGRKGVKGSAPGPVLDWMTRVKIALGAAKGLE